MVRQAREGRFGMTSRRATSAGVLLLCLQLALPVRPALGGDSASGATPQPLVPAGQPVTAQAARQSVAVRLRPALAASVFALGSAAVMLEVESDRAYARYLDTADPRRMTSYYDSSERKRNLSTAALVGAEVCAVALVVTYLFETRPAEPEPGSVIISLAVAPGRLGVRVGW